MENDTHWYLAMQEVVLCSSPWKLRELFGILIGMCGLSKPLELWQDYRNDLSEDILRRRQEINSEATFDDDIYNEALIIIEDKLISMLGKDVGQFGIPRPVRLQNVADELSRELSYSLNDIDAEIAEKMPKLLPEQKIVFEKIITQISRDDGSLFFLDAPGGTGKTFLLNLLLAYIRKDSNIAIAVASSEIAATLLSGGRTAHSALKLPLNSAQSEAPTCNIRKNSSLGASLRRCKLLVWDECTMSHKHAIGALNRSLQDIRSRKALMGGLVVLLAGDFRQTLPVISKGTAADEINACLKASHLWNQVSRLSLSTNMRVHLFNDSTAETHAAELLKIGNGEVAKDINGEIAFKPSFCNLVSSEEQLLSEVYPEINRKLINR